MHSNGLSNPSKRKSPTSDRISQDPSALHAKKIKNKKKQVLVSNNSSGFSHQSALKSYRDRLKLMLTKLSNGFAEPIEFDRRIFGTNVREHISKEVIEEVLNQKWLSASAINM